MLNCVAPLSTAARPVPVQTSSYSNSNIIIIHRVDTHASSDVFRIFATLSIFGVGSTSAGIVGIPSLLVVAIVKAQKTVD